MEKTNTSNSYWLSSGFYALLNQLTQMVFNLGSVMLLLRLLDKQTCGSWILFMTLTSFIEVARTGLLQNGMISFLSTAPKSEYPKILTASVVLNLGLSVVFAALLLGGGHFVAQFFGNDAHLGSLLRVYALTTFGFSALYQFNFIQQANLDFKGLFWSSFVKNGGLFFYIVYLFLSQKPFGLTEIAFCQLLTTIPSALVAFRFAKPYLDFSSKIDFNWVKELFGYGKFAMGTNFFTMLFKNVDRTLLGKYFIGALSTYDLALKINQLAEVPTTTLATILFPKSAQRANDADGGRGAARQLYEKSVGVLLALILPMTVGVILFADLMVWIIGSDKYSAAAPVLRLTIFYGFFTAYAIQFGTILDSLKRPDLNFYITALGAMVNLACNWWFIQQYGVWGAIVGTLLGSTIMFVVMQTVLNRQIGTSPFRPVRYMFEFYQTVFQKIKNRFAQKNVDKLSENVSFSQENVEKLNGNSKIVENYTHNPQKVENAVAQLSDTGGGQFSASNPTNLAVALPENPPKIAKETEQTKDKKMMNRHEIDVVIFTLFRDDSQYSSVSMSLAKEFAKNHRVFYINHPYSFKDWWTMRSTKTVERRAAKLARREVSFEPHPTIPNVTIITPPPTTPINFLANGGLYNFWHRRNNRKLESTLRQTIERFGIKNFVYYNCYNPFFLNKMPQNLPVQPVANVYHCIDDLDQDPYTAKHGIRLERLSIENADIAITTSTELRKKYLPIKPTTEILTNAVDISIFRKVVTEKLARPKEIKGVTTKIIGFTGNLDYLRIDYPLLKKIALHHRDKTLVIVGPINSKEFYEVGLDKIDNVIFTGAKKIDELPNYVQYFDVAIIPFLLNAVTRSIYPLKINEYLAAGRAVVSTIFSEDIQFFKDVIYLADSHDDFLKKLDQAIAENDDNRLLARVEVASRNTWADRVEQFWDLVADFSKKSQK